MTRQPVRVGAVMYDPKVSVIWRIIQEFFEERLVPIDVTFFNTYALQVDALLDGRLDIAWNSPLAWLDASRRSAGHCRAIAMRDTDRDRVSYIVARTDGPVRSLNDLSDRTIAVGAMDSPQATLIPLELLRQHGLDPGEGVRVRRFDILVGKHGDHVGGELAALRCLVDDGAQACTMLDLNWDTWTRDGTIDSSRYRVVASTSPFDHCVFTTAVHLDEAAEAAWQAALFSMDYSDPRHREMMDLEGLRSWLPGRTTGFAALTRAVDAFGFFEQG